jgi:hypothetical protein
MVIDPIPAFKVLPLSMTLGARILKIIRIENKFSFMDLLTSRLCNSVVIMHRPAPTPAAHKYGLACVFDL